MAEPKKMRWVLPEVVHPSEEVCYIVRVPKERAYIAAFLGAMFNLVKPYNWANDDAHTAVEVGAVWGEIFDDLLKKPCFEPGPDAVTGGCGDDCMGCCLRFNNGVLEQLVCGVWVAVDGQPEGGIFAPPQPGGGSEQPAPGECAQYHATLTASGKWLLPVALNTGDTVEILSATGAGNDGEVPGWYCPDGSLFFAGACISGSHTDATDPLPTAPHMSLVLNVDGNWLYPIGGPVTVPSGVSNGQAYIQINDDTLADNSGSYSYEVQVCNNSTVTFRHVFDLRLSPGPWNIAQIGDGGEFAGNWSPGSGFVATDYPRAGLNRRGISIYLAMPSRDVTGEEVVYDLAMGTIDSPSGFDVYNFAINATQIDARELSDVTQGTNVDKPYSVAVTAATSISLDIVTARTSGAADGSATIKTIVISGLGSDPWA